MMHLEGAFIISLQGYSYNLINVDLSDYTNFQSIKTKLKIHITINTGINYTRTTIRYCIKFSY